MAHDDGRDDVAEGYREVSALFGALAAPVRAAIVHALTAREHSVTELVERLHLSQPLVSQHLRTLREAGLVAVDRQGRNSVYRLVDDHVAHVFLDALQHSRERTGV